MLEYQQKSFTKLQINLETKIYGQKEEKIIGK